MFRQTTPNFRLFVFYYYLKQQLEEFERKIFPVAAEESPSFESRNEFQVLSNHGQQINVLISTSHEYVHKRADEVSL